MLETDEETKGKKEDLLDMVVKRWIPKRKDLHTLEEESVVPWLEPNSVSTVIVTPQDLDFGLWISFWI